MTPARFTAVWLIGQFVGLVVLFHAGPWPWASRSLSMAAALVPAWALLLRAGWNDHQFVCGVLASTTLVALMVAVINLTTPLGAGRGSVLVAYRFYVYAYVAAQMILALCWVAWWRAGGTWPALGGGLLAAVGAAASSWAHGLRPTDDILAMEPWAHMWSGAHGPVDVVSRVAPKLLALEVGVLGGASIVLAVIALRLGSQASSPGGT